MNDPRIELTKSWLTKAEHDLDSAKKLSEEPNPLFDTAIYHCQQVAEKALKGYLAFLDQPLEKTHDIRVLVQMGIQTDARFSRLMEDAERLTPYAEEFRYPGDENEPSKEEFDLAMQSSEKIFSFVMDLLSNELRQ